MPETGAFCKKKRDRSCAHYRTKKETRALHAIGEIKAEVELRGLIAKRAIPGSTISMPQSCKLL